MRRILNKRFFSSCATPLPSSLECEYLVVGGGPVGCSIAYHLSKEIDTKHNRIIVLEKDFCYRATSAMLSAGGIRQQFSLPENIKICMYGADFIKNPEHFTIPGEDPIDIQFNEIGYLFLAGEKSRNILLENYNTQHECGATWIELLEKENLQKEFPWLNTTNLDAGTFGRKNEGYFDPWAYVNALKKKSISQGVQFIEGQAVGGCLQPISRGSSSSFNIESVNFYTSSSNNNTNTNKNQHKIYAKNVINAAGAWSGRFLESLLTSVPTSKGIARIPVAPRARHIFGFSCRGQEHCSSPMPSPQTPLTVDPSGVYFRPEGKQPGKYIGGVSPAEEADREVLPEEEAQVLQSVDENLFEETIWPTLAELVPAFEGIKLNSSWTGFYDYNSLDQVT
jgi:FAD-dependent oxidoreductase domain-containing protein 1